MYVYVCAYMTLCTHVQAVPTEARRGNQIPLELKLQTVVRLLMRGWGS